MTEHLATITKDPNDKRLTGFDWDDDSLLTNRATTITTSTWTVPSGLTAVSNSNTTTKTVVLLTGGTAGTDYTVTNHVVLANGEEFDRSKLVRVRSR
jgi:hypothetical protein